MPGDPTERAGESRQPQPLAGNGRAIVGQIDDPPRRCCAASWSPSRAQSKAMRGVTTNPSSAQRIAGCSNSSSPRVP